MSRKPNPDQLLVTLEKQVNGVLKNQELTASERLKAIEVGAKLLMIRHKITDGERADGAFFAK